MSSHLICIRRKCKLRNFKPQKIEFPFLFVRILTFSFSSVEALINKYFGWRPNALHTLLISPIETNWLRHFFKCGQYSMLRSSVLPMDTSACRPAKTLDGTTETLAERRSALLSEPRLTMWCHGKVKVLLLSCTVTTVYQLKKCRRNVKENGRFITLFLGAVWRYFTFK